MRQLIAALAGILLLVVVSLVVILRCPSGTWFPQSGSEPQASAPPAPPPPAPPPESRLEAVRRELARPELPTPPVLRGPPRTAPPEGSWEAIPVAARASELGPIGAAIGRGLNELQPRLSACFEEAARSSDAAQAVTGVADAAPIDDHGTTVLTLQVETLRDAARIVDAPVSAYGGASAALVACAQRVLRGQVVRGPQITAGSRHRLLFSLTQ